MCMCMCMHHTHMSLHVLLYPHGAQERGCTACAWSVLLSGWSGCVGLSALLSGHCVMSGCRVSGSCRAVTSGPDSNGAPLMSDSAVRLSDTCCQTVRRKCCQRCQAVGHCQALSGVCWQALSDQGSGALRAHPTGNSWWWRARAGAAEDHKEYDNNRGVKRSLRDHTPLLKIPVWWRRAVLPSLPWVVCLFSFFLSACTHPCLFTDYKSEMPGRDRGTCMGGADASARLVSGVSFVL